MVIINLNSTNHTFEKQNLVTLSDKRGAYDIYKCSACGLFGKVRNMIEIRITKGKKYAYNCPNVNTKLLVDKYVRITYCSGFGKSFTNLKPDTIHKIIPAPEGEDNSRGVWVMGVDKPVKILFNEYKLIEED